MQVKQVVSNQNIEKPEEGRVYAEGDTGVEQEETRSEETITEPFDPTEIRVSPIPMTIDLLCTRMRENELNLSPDFQRKAGIWTEGVQSRLIESILIRIPLPAFYIDGTDDDCWLVVDGLQRLTAIKRFVIDENLRLSELEFLKDFNGKGYAELPRGFQRRINETQVTVFKIEKGTPGRVKFNIFKRINTGGLPLSAQEIRHALNQGKATKLLNELSISNEFKRATDYGIRDTRMADKECVLRFIAFTLFNYTQYKVPDLDGFLNQIMARINGQMSNQEIEKLKNQFDRTMRAAIEIFGNNAFRKYYGGHSRYPINKALFEAWSVNLNKLTDQQLKRLIEQKNDLKKRFSNLMRDPEFERAVSQGTGDIRKVNIRFSKIEGLLKEALQ